MSLSLMLSWWNLIYIVPFLLALIYLGLFVFTGITFGDADVDVDADVDADADAGAHVEAHTVEAHTVEAHTVEAEAGEADADHDAGDHEASDAPGPAIVPHAHANASVDADVSLHPIMTILSLLGVGKIPLSLALMILCFSWGVVGFLLNGILYQWLGATFVIGFISLPITLLLSMIITGLCAAGVAKVIPNDDSARQRRQDLVGKPGEAVYDIDASFGMASVRGDAGDYFQIPCRTREGRIAKGSRVVIFDYDRNQGVFHVAPFEK